MVFTQCELTEAVLCLQTQNKLDKLTVPLIPLGKIADLGPYHLQVKGKGAKGLFDCSAGKPSGLQIPALWHHEHDQIKTLEVSANAVLKRRQGRKTEQDAMLGRAGRLQLASEVGHAPQRLAATITDPPMLGVRSWITLNFKQHQQGVEEAMCLWLNSTPGLLLRIAHANRPYLGRSSVPHELAETMPVLDVTKLSQLQLNAAHSLLNNLKGTALQGFAQINTDPVRQCLNRKLIKDVLQGGGIDVAYVDKLTSTLADEPLLTTRH